MERAKQVYDKEVVNVRYKWQEMNVVKRQIIKLQRRTEEGDRYNQLGQAASTEKQPSDSHRFDIVLVGTTLNRHRFDQPRFVPGQSFTMRCCVSWFSSSPVHRRRSCSSRGSGAAASVHLLAAGCRSNE